MPLATFLWTPYFPIWEIGPTVISLLRVGGILETQDLGWSGCVNEVVSMPGPQLDYRRGTGVSGTDPLFLLISRDLLSSSITSIRL